MVVVVEAVDVVVVEVVLVVEVTAVVVVDVVVVVIVDGVIVVVVGCRGALAVVGTFFIGDSVAVAGGGGTDPIT